MKKEKHIKFPFSFRVRLGDYEVEISGTREETLETVKELPALLSRVSKAFESVTLKIVAAKMTKSTEAKAVSIPYPKISGCKSCSEAVLKLLDSDWGRWRPRTLAELMEAMKVNALHYPSSTLSGVLTWLVKRGKIRRWKTDEGYVYILAEADQTEKE